MEKLIMIKYGELTTKKGNRDNFISCLLNNIHNKLKSYDVKITKDRSRMYIESKDIDEISEVLTNIFGVHGIVIAYKINTNNIEDIKKASLEVLNFKNFKTFKVVTNRALKDYPMDSMKISRVVGGYI